MTRVFLRPDAATIAANNGIGRVVHAQQKWLPRFDVELVATEDRADVVAGHTHDYGASRLDVCHVHGLYWSGDPGSGEYTNWHHEANARIIAAVRRARVLTVPSRWVAMPFKRDMRLNPVILGHGIEPNEWGRGSSLGYVLWNKNRPDDVCNPRWPFELAKRGQNVVSTFIPKGEQIPQNLNLRVVGTQPADKMRELVLGADVYLATTKETFGIGTLEALACGVPVLGFNWGGTADLVAHEQNGYLAEPGDLEGLLEGLSYIRAHRIQMSKAAIESARAYSWEHAIGRYAELYHQLAAAGPEPAGVAVVIPCHNYGRYLGECLDSVLAQTHRPEEIVVVDDASTDDSAAVAASYADRGVRLIRLERNAGVAAARNTGIEATTAPYLICLDADDMLDPRYVATCRAEMVRDRGLGLVWTGLSVLRPGKAPTGNVWSGPFDWAWQASVKAGDAPHTTIPTGAMFRRAMYERAGGYKQEHAPGEDAEFYTRGLSVGFTAKKATELPFFLYRDHGEGAHIQKVYKPIDTWHPWMRDHAYPLGAPADQAPDVRSYSDPKVSVIIPVGPGHGKYLPDALESLLGQTMREWEVIVVSDGDHDANVLATARFPFVRMYLTDAKGGKGPGAARNMGLRNAHAPLVLFLDADDVLEPHALARMCQAYADGGGRYIYGDWQFVGETTAQASSEYDAAGWLTFPRPATQHAVTVLMATADARMLRFDESLPVWEDWDFFIRAAIAGVHGQRLPVVTLYVRRSADGRTASAAQHQGEVIGLLKSKYKEAKMGSCCGGNGAAAIAAKQAFAGVLPEREAGLSIRRTTKGNGAAPVVDTDAPVVRMEFTGQRTGAVTYRGLRGREYRGGNNAHNRFANVHPEDVATLESSGQWRRVGIALGEPAQAPRVQAPVAPEPMTQAPAPAAGPVAQPLEPVAVPYSVGQAVEAVEPLITVHGPAEGVTAANLTTGKPVPVTVVPPAEPQVQAIQNGEEVVKRKRVKPPSKSTNLKTDLTG